jgi:hypothetical protein
MTQLKFRIFDGWRREIIRDVRLNLTIAGHGVKRSACAIARAALVEG